MHYLVTSLSDLETIRRKIETTVNESLDRRSSGPDLLQGEISDQDYDGIIFSKKYIDILVLLTIVTFKRDYFNGFAEYLLYEIELYLNKNRIFVELCALCRLTTNKISFIHCILNYSRKSSLNSLVAVLQDGTTVDRTVSMLRLKFIPHHRPKRLIRHKGYRDHGTLRPPDRWSEVKDFTFDELQNQREEEQNRYQDATTDIVRECGDWYLKLIQRLKGE